MKITEQIDLIQYGRTIDIQVEPKLVDGEVAVAYTDNLTTDYYRAMSDLQTLARQLECAI